MPTNEIVATIPKAEVFLEETEKWCILLHNRSGGRQRMWIEWTAHGANRRERYSATAPAQTIFLFLTRCTGNLKKRKRAGTHGDSKAILLLARRSPANPASDDGTLVSGRTTPFRRGLARRWSSRLWAVASAARAVGSIFFSSSLCPFAAPLFRRPSATASKPGWLVRVAVVALSPRWIGRRSACSIGPGVRAARAYARPCFHVLLEFLVLKAAIVYRKNEP